MTTAPTVDAPGKLTTDPDLNRPPAVKLIAIEWDTVKLTSDADALALWKQIAPTGDDWSDKLDEIPSEGPIAGQLGLALLRAGNFTCVPPAPPKDCAKTPFDIPEPAKSATLDDPCLRRMLAMWSIEVLDDDQLALAQPQLKQIVAIPPPESQLISVALKAMPEASAYDKTLELFAIAFAAGHRDLVNGMIGQLDEAHTTKAVVDHKIDGALDVLGIESHRSLFLAAITDDKLAPKGRMQAMTELVASEEKMSKETRDALVKATKAQHCGVVAQAQRHLVAAGDKKAGPARPRTMQPKVMMRSLCVLASFELLQRADEPSYLLGYVPKKGLELVKVAYDAYNDTDADGDGDPHTERTTTIINRDEIVLPEIEDMIRAFDHCTGTVCKSDDREFRFTFKGTAGELLLTKLEVIERPPCKTPAIPNP